MSYWDRPASDYRADLPPGTSLRMYARSLCNKMSANKAAIQLGLNVKTLYSAVKYCGKGSKRTTHPRGDLYSVPQGKLVVCRACLGNGTVPFPDPVNGIRSCSACNGDGFLWWIPQEQVAVLMSSAFIVTGGEIT